ncbi:uncharacterized protein LOC133195569 [Saccostrea echinata]|uniref:uncharacterized protein LOC133195569 n=1 Tax=Saccostrea echinata TaxID=191078 RepID=UPI002A811580|nr:uncharacterized protein LOC133195569 [Saccostrea echinata]
MSGSPNAVCDATGVWLPVSGSVPECSSSYLKDVWFILVLSLLGFIAIVIILLLLILCCRFCCIRNRVDDEESEAGGRGCCPCCRSSSEEEEEEKPKPRMKPLTTAKKSPNNKINKPVTKNKITKKKVVSKKGKIMRSKKGVKTLKKGKEKATVKTKEDRPLNSREAKSVTEWKPFAKPVRNINTSTK